MSLGLRLNPTSQVFAAGATITPTALSTTGWASGDIVLCFVHVVSTAACTPTTATSGWTNVGTVQQGTTGVSSALLSFRYTGTYTTPVITWTGSYKSSVKFVVLSGAPSSSYITATATNSGSGTAMTASSATASTRGSLRLIDFFKATRATAFTALSADMAQLEQADVGTATATGRFGLFAQWGMAENAQGTKLATQSTTASWIAWEVWVAPATADTFGWLRFAAAGTRGTAATSKTAALSGSDVAGTNTGTTIAVFGAAFNSAMTVTIGGVAPTAGPNLGISSGPGDAGWYAYNQTAANGTSVNVVLTRASGSDSIEVWAGEFLGAATAASPLDQTGSHQSASGATSNAVSTSAATASGTELSVYCITNDTNPGALVADTAYNVNDSQQSGTTAAIPLLVASRQFTGGSTETATSTTSASNSLALIMTFAAPSTVTTQAISGTVAGTRPGISALPSPALHGLSAYSRLNTDYAVPAKALSGTARYSTVLAEHALSNVPLIGRAGPSVSTGHATPLAPLSGRSIGRAAPAGSAGRPLAGLASNGSTRASMAGRTNLGAPVGRGASLLDRAQLATWRNLGQLTADVFHESDILYDDVSGYYYVINTSADGNSGDPHIGWRRATTLEGIVAATGADRVERALNVLYYPSAIKDGADWRVIGTAATVTTYTNKYTGAAPPGWLDANSIKLGTNLGLSAVPLVDSSIRKNPADGYYYVVGLSDSGGTPFPTYLHRTRTPDTQNTWRRVGVDIFNAGLPWWAAVSIFDPNLMFVDGRTYLGFSGNDGSIVRSGIIEIDPNTATPIGDAIILDYQGQYSWQPTVLSDLVFLRCPDNIDRIFGFCNGPYDGSMNGAWACLDLQPSAQRWYMTGPAVRGLAHPYANGKAPGVTNALVLAQPGMKGAAPARAQVAGTGRTMMAGTAEGHSAARGSLLTSAIVALAGTSVGQGIASGMAKLGLTGKSEGRATASLTAQKLLVGKSEGRATALLTSKRLLAGKSEGRASGALVPQKSLAGKSFGRTSAAATTTPAMQGRAAGQAQPSLQAYGNMIGRSAGQTAARLLAQSRALAGNAAGRTVSSLLPRTRMSGTGTGHADAHGYIAGPNLVSISGTIVGRGMAAAKLSKDLAGTAVSASGAAMRPASKALTGTVASSAGAASGLVQAFIRGIATGYAQAQATGSKPVTGQATGRSDALAAPSTAMQGHAEGSTGVSALLKATAIVALAGRSVGGAMGSGAIGTALSGTANAWAQVRGILTRRGAIPAGPPFAAAEDVLQLLARFARLFVAVEADVLQLPARDYTLEVVRTTALTMEARTTVLILDKRV